MNDLPLSDSHSPSSGPLNSLELTSLTSSTVSFLATHSVDASVLMKSNVREDTEDNEILHTLVDQCWREQHWQDLPFQHLSPRPQPRRGSLTSSQSSCCWWWCWWQQPGWVNDLWDQNQQRSMQWYKYIVVIQNIWFFYFHWQKDSIY